MIKITKPGKTIRYEFVCYKCGCEYTADLADVRKLYCGEQEWADCKCPNCDTMNFGAEIKYDEELEKMTRYEEKHVSQIQIKNEIQRRLDILGYDVRRMYQYLLVPKDPVTLTRDLVLYFDAADLGPEGDEIMIIKNIETNYGVKVYAAITTQCGELGEMLTLLTIYGNKAEWQREREDLEARMPIAYVQNLTYPELSEWGTVMLKTHDGIVERIW